MKPFLKNGIQEVELFSLIPPLPAEDEAGLPDPAETRRFIRPLVNDPMAIRTIREGLARTAPHVNVSTFSNHELANQVASKLAQDPAAVGFGVSEAAQIGGLGEKQEELEFTGTAAPTQIKPPEDKAWIKFQVIDDDSEEPLGNIALVIKDAGGWLKEYTTNDRGIIEIKKTDRGECEAQGKRDGARIKTTYQVVSVSPGEPIDKEAVMLKGGPWKILNVQEHKVKNGDSILSLATANDMKWQDLALFNWDTAVPKEINKHLRDEVGCTKKTKDGYNYVFTDQDDPGIVYIPKDWEQTGLSTEQTHIIRVSLEPGLVILLEDEFGHAIPETDYKIVFFDGSKDEGKLGKAGVKRFKSAPKGPFALVYPDNDDILAKSIAACVREALGQQRTEEVFRALQYPPETVKQAIAAYDKYFNDLTGMGMVEDIYQVVTDEDALAGIEALFAYNDIPPRSNIEVIQRLNLFEEGLE